MKTVDLAKTFKFHHKDDPVCIYTRTPDGVISWDSHQHVDCPETDAGEDTSYTNYMVMSYFNDGTWVLVEDK